jgi:hypothetical protein
MNRAVKLYGSAANGHTETVWTLLAAGADVRARKAPPCGLP